MADVDQQILLRGFLRIARNQEDPVTWLETLQAAAVTAITGGDIFVTATGFEGENSTLERKFLASDLLQLTELALLQLEAEESAGDDALPATGSVKYPDYSYVPAKLG